ncbi:unnamed protein product [Acanthosepion pharaonis]|uniref:Uncharacterized protein n=1 Tax=Acanthosepion pharaonis TaxID=158019 RepID=A0A812C8X9_ACAPH|nr:unnamed protein product [Sepia pharaonis]
MSNSPISASKLDYLLQTLVCKEKEIIDNVFTAFKGRESLNQFISSDLSKLFGIVAAYIDCFQSLQIKKRDELSSVLTKYYRAENIEERANQLLEVETEWDEMLDQIDKALFAEQQQQSPTVEMDLCIPLDHATQVESRLDEIKAAGAHVMLVTFGLLDGARQWLKETNSSLPFYQDPSRNLYTTFGLSRSVKKVWGMASMICYAEHLCSGHTLPKPYENYQEDIFQMGGDFITNQFGSVIFAYCSKTSADRPSVDQILYALQNTTSCESHKR